MSLDFAELAVGPVSIAGYVLPRRGGLTGAGQKLDSVQIQSTMTNLAEHVYRVLASGRKEFELNLGVYGQVRERKQAHAVIANIDAECFEAARLGEYTDRGVEQLTASAATIWLEGASEKHWARVGTK